MAAMKLQSPSGNPPAQSQPLGGVVGNQQQLHSPVLSTASSITNDSSAATRHPSSPDASSESAAATPMNSAPETNHNSPTTPVVSHEYDSGFSMDSKTMSPENGDTKCSGSVIEKASLFERLECKKSASPPVGATPVTGMSPMNRSESLYGRRNEEIYRACGTLDSGTWSDWVDVILQLVNWWNMLQDHHSLE